VSLFFQFSENNLTSKNHVIRGLGIFTPWHEKKDTIICIYPKVEIERRQTSTTRAFNSFGKPSFVEGSNP